MSEYALMKMSMDKMFKAFDKAEIGTTVSIVEMPYDETTELNESNFTLFL
jgi:hypothetical protein